MHHNFRTELIIILCFVALSLPYRESYASEQSGQASSQSTWIHSDVYETRVDKDAGTHTCTIISKGDELLVTIEVRNPVNEKTFSGGKEGNIVIDGHIHRFKINKTDGNVVALSWTVYGETDKGGRTASAAKRGPSAKVMLEPFREVLRKLPSDIYPLLERVLKVD
jgi:hypothetical protein